jgi:threonine/homoserine/homoserine lactone efflux protein
LTEVFLEAENRTRDNRGDVDRDEQPKRSALAVETLVAGFGIALLVSAPPGANTALCVTSARHGARRAVPVILGAAATDIMYALLAAAGVMVVTQAGTLVVHLVAAVFCTIGAAFMWTQRAPSFGSRTTFSIALLNPATAALWFGLSALAITHPHGLVPTASWVIGVGMGTTTWFSLLALASARAQHRLGPAQILLVQRVFAVALMTTALLLLV